ncbi:MAG: beta-glucuronidase, partial [Muribaculaceae bacterium]|nr:beta-glucuronidase [Muribaculaceae bacterium]
MALAATLPAAAQKEKTIDLSGEWDFGYGDTKVYDDRIQLPGSMLTNGKGNDVDASTKWTGSLYDMSYYFRDDLAPYREKGNVKFPFFLTPGKEYVGDAYYHRKVRIPSDWKGKRVVLSLERPHIETTLYVNGKEVGHRMSLSTPHEYDITDFMKAGKENEIELKIYNGIENVCVGQDSHSVTDQTQGNWNGVTGTMSLRATPKDSYIRNVRVFPDVKGRKATVRVIRGGKSGKPGAAKVKAVAPDGVTEFTAAASGVKGDTLSYTIDFGDRMQTWSEFSTPLYNLT